MRARHIPTTGRDWLNAGCLAVLVSALWLTAANVDAQSLGDSDPPAVQASVEQPVLVSHAAVLPDQDPSATPADNSVWPAPDPAEVPKAAASPAQAVPAAAPLEGWSTFQIKKTRAELTETARLADLTEAAIRTGPNDVKPPPQRDVLRLSTGIGYLQGADWGGDVSAVGKINGMLTDVSAFITAGPLGFQSRSGHVSLFSPDGTWRGEGGDLYSDLRGLARGARVSWSDGPRWTPSISLYLQRQGSLSNATTVLAYRDRLQVLPRVRVGGEVTSDGAAFLH